MESVKDYFEINWGSFWNYFGIILESFWDQFGIILGSCWDHFRISVGTCWDNFGITFHQQKNDALNYPGIFMLVIGTGGGRMNPKFSN